jgi:hypothetical protein
MKSNYKYYPLANQLSGQEISTKNPDLLSFFIFKGLSHNPLDIRPNLEAALDHTPIIATISTHILYNSHNSETNWESFRTQIEENLRLNIALKTAKDIEEDIAEFNNVIQKRLGAQQYTTNLNKEDRRINILDTPSKLNSDS